MRKVTILLMALGACCLVGFFSVASAFDISEEKIFPSDGTPGDVFGNSVSISGNYAIVGAFGDSDNGSNSGAAYIFERIDGSWIEKTKLLASDGKDLQEFGTAVAISGDYAIVGADWDDENGPFSGAAYIFERVDGNWIEKTKLLASDRKDMQNFGWSVAISGTYAIVGVYPIGNFSPDIYAAYIFERIDGNWIEKAKLLANDGLGGGWFGRSVSISGNYAIVGAPGDYENGSASGAVYIFERINGNWVKKAKLHASDGKAYDAFGLSASISGNHAIVSAITLSTPLPIESKTSAAYVFELIDGNWVENGKLVSSDEETEDKFGCSVSISGNYAVVGAKYDDDNGTYSGAAYIYKRIDGNWVEKNKIILSDGEIRDSFGYSVMLAGNQAIIGAVGDVRPDIYYREGSAYIFTLTTDEDEDGIDDDEDLCLDTAPGEIVNESGCSIADLCPVDDEWRNHGAYARCVIRTAKSFYTDDLLTRKELRTIIQDATHAHFDHGTHCNSRHRYLKKIRFDHKK